MTCLRGLKLTKKLLKNYLFRKFQEKQGTFEYTQDGYKVNFNLQENEKLYITVPDINGLHYYLNGEEIKVDNFCGYMVQLSSDTQENTLVVKYKYPYLIIWLLFAIIAIIICIVILMLYKKTQFKHIQTIISKIMLSIGIFILVFVYVLGTMFSIVWFFI